MKLETFRHVAKSRPTLSRFRLVKRKTAVN